MSPILERLEATRGVVALVDLSDHLASGGVRWPTGLDLNRGRGLTELDGPVLSGTAKLVEKLAGRRAR